MTGSFYIHMSFPGKQPLGVKSLIRNGVRASLIPILASFFERRSMRVAWTMEREAVLCEFSARLRPAGEFLGDTGVPLLVKQQC